MSEFLLHTLPPGTLIKGYKTAPDGGVPIELEWQEPDGSVHIMRVLEDPLSPTGLRVEEVVYSAKNVTLEIGTEPT